MARNIVVNFSFKPRPWQQKCFEIQKRYTVLACHRRSGKSTLALAELITKALQDTSGGNYVYIAPELKQARRIAWKTLKQMCSCFLGVDDGQGGKFDLVRFYETDATVVFNNTNSTIMLLGADNPDNIRGSKLAGAVIDEVAQMPKEIWGEIVRPALMDSHGWALFIGTPKGVNFFSELFDRGQNPDYQDEWISQKFTCYETGALSEKEIEAYKRDEPEETFKREMLCDFSASASDQLINLFTAQQAAQKSINPNYLGNTPLVLGVDVARFGEDRSVLCYRKGILCYDPITVKDVDLVTLAGVVKNSVRQWHPKAIFVDGTGVGGGLADILHSVGIDCRDINFGSKSSEPEFANKRTEMWCKVADWLGKGGILPHGNDELVAELAMPTYVVNERNQKVLESKPKIKDRLGRSPDLADALALTFADEVAPDDPIMGMGGMEDQYLSDDYDPIQNYEDQAARDEVAERIAQWRSSSPFE